MNELVGDLFKQSCNAICITTNGIIKNDGTAVMGAGVAKKAAVLYPWMPKTLGECLTLWGNQVHLLTQKRHPILSVAIGIGGRPVCITDVQTTLPYDILSFPTKHHWRNDSDLNLIEASLKSLVAATDQNGWSKVCLPRFGTGLGNLDWNDQVKPLATEYLDDRFIIVNNKK